MKFIVARTKCETHKVKPHNVRVTCTYRNFTFMQIIKPKSGWGEVKVIWEVLPTTQIETLSMQST